MSSKSANHVAAKIVSLLVGDYSARMEIRAVEEIAYGQRVRMWDATADEEFVVSVEKFNGGPAIEAKAAKTPGGYLADVNLSDDEAEAEAEAEDLSEEPPF